MQGQSISDRFWSKVDRSSDTEKCWLWIAATTPNLRRTSFYGHFVIGGKHYKSHRVAFELTFGKIPADRLVLHRCDVSLCCNPNHLYLGTQKDNMADRKRGNRGNHPNGSAHGRAKVTEEQVREIRKRHESGELAAHLAREYGMTRTNMASILRRKIWAHVS